MADDWKNHPVIIAAITCASTAAFFVTVAQPMIDKNNQNKISLLTESNLKLELAIAERNKEIIKLKAHIESTISDKEKQIEIAKSEAEKYKNEDRFSSDNPLPKGLREIKIFSPYSEIKNFYPNSDFNENTLYYSIEIDDKLFSSAIYYPAKCNNRKVIKEIRFRYRTTFDDYKEAQKSKNFDYLEQPVPSIEEIEKSSKQRREAVTRIFHEKFENTIEENEENETIFIINESIAAMTDDNYLYIFSRYTDEEINEICSNASSCPVPD